MTAAAPSPEDLAATDRAERIAHYAGQVAAAEANIAGTPGLEASDLLGRLCAGPDGSLSFEKVARLALAALYLVDWLYEELVSGDECDVLGLQTTVLEIVADELGHGSRGEMPTATEVAKGTLSGPALRVLKGGRSA